MDDLRFGWIGRTRRAVLEEMLAMPLEQWARDWWLAYASGQFSCKVVDELDSEACAPEAWVATSSSGALAIHVGTCGLDVFGCHLASMTADEDAPLAATLGEQAINDLSASIHRRAGANSSTAPARQALPVSLAQTRAGAIAVSITLGRLPMVVTVDRRLGESLAPPSTGPGLATLVARRDALAHAPVRISAILSFGEVDLAQLADLAVGEVLVADRKLDDALHIHVDGKGAVATGCLRRSGNQRAVALDGAITSGAIPS